MKLAGLNQTQINNWFINQRKRHWHRLFDRDEAQPISETEARHDPREVRKRRGVP